MKKIFVLTSFMFLGLIFARCDQSKKTERDSSLPVADKKIADPTDQDFRAGKKVYDIYCLMCHGKDGTKVLTGNYDLNKSRLNLDEIIEVTRTGRTSMMAYQDILSEEELRVVAKYTLGLQH